MNKVLVIYGVLFIVCLGGRQYGAFAGPVTDIERKDDLFPLSIAHMNDFHARFEETNTRSTPCKPEAGEQCIGGYARVVHTVKQIQQNSPNAIYLNAGDNFQGTLWYNIGRWNVTSHFLNMLKADAIVLGNHEFDNSIEGVVPYLEHIQSPILVANIDASAEPSMENKFQKSLIIDRFEQKVGIIGVILSTTYQIAQTRKLKFINESDAIRVEAAKLKAQGVNIIIVLSHCGLDVDYEIARNVGSEIDVIVGGHSHTFMYTGEKSPGPDYPRDEYPAVVRLPNDHKVLIVQASCYTKYLGNLTVYFNAEGNVDSWDGAPIFLDSNIEKDADIVRALQPWKEIIDVEGNREIGIARTPLDRGSCSSGECSIGNFLAAAAVDYYVKQADEDYWTYAAIAFIPIGGIRTNINKGPITYADLMTAQPFENTLDTIELRGVQIIDMLEYSVASTEPPNKFSSRNMLQFHGLKVVYNVSRPIGQRTMSVHALCNKCLIPEYKPLQLNETYRIIVPSFLISGGDGFDMIPNYGRNHRIGIVDNKALQAYMKRMSPIVAAEDKRLIVLK